MDQLSYGRQMGKAEQTDSRREQLRLINATIAIHKNKESRRQANRERFNTAKPVDGIDGTVTANNMKKKPSITWSVQPWATMKPDKCLSKYARLVGTN